MRLGTALCEFLGAVSFLYVSENVSMAGAVSGVSGRALRLAPADIISAGR
jgi:hypothetical protein